MYKFPDKQFKAKIQMDKRCMGCGREVGGSKVLWDVRVLCGSEVGVWE